jgi:nitrogen regulatory protein PII
MKTIEAVIPNQKVRTAIDELRVLEVDDITVEPVKVFKKDVHQQLIYRGCTYEQNFVFESQLRFHVSDQDAPRAEAILASR